MFKMPVRNTRISQIKGLATTLYLAHHLKKPIFLEGEPGVGKTEVAKVLADATGAKAHPVTVL